MNIEQQFHEEIRALDVNAYKVSCEYSYWDDGSRKMNSCFRESLK